MTKDKRIRILLHLSTGGLVIITAMLADYVLGNSTNWGPIQVLALVFGLVIILLGIVPKLGLLSRASTNICLLVLSLLVLLALGEVFFKAIGYDFAGQERAWRKHPPFWQKPRVPMEEGFFRRAPQSWTGQVLNTQLKIRNILPNPYNNDPVITVKYNRFGFRNPYDISDWDIVVVGDSFTELGYLPYEELFTTILGKILNVSVLNLGASYASSFTELNYLREYGTSASTKHAIIVFFEGNDLRDLGKEYKALIRWRETGQHDTREFKRQPSLAKAFLIALNKTLSGSVEWSPKPRNRVNAYFKSSQGDIPLTLKYTPLDSSELTEETVNQLNFFFNEYVSFGAKRQITIWLAYMPSKRRVLDGHIQFTNGVDEKLRSWQSTDLPDFISKLCDQYGIRFINLTPALVKETKNSGRLVYNSIHDTHLNSFGSLLVAQEMARHLAAQDPRSPN